MGGQTDSTEEVTPGTGVEAVKRQVVAALDSGTVSLSDLLKIAAAPPDPLPVPVALPLPAQITDKQREALEQLPKVYGKVVPIERRMLEPVEIKALYDERVTLDQIEKMASDRKTAIRTTVLNHHDVGFEQSGGSAERDKDGHYIAPAAVPIPDTDQCFSVEVRAGQASITADALKALVDAGELEHDDYLEMTTQTRYVDEDKVRLKLRKKPELVAALGKATTMGRPVLAFQPRRRKP